jgi:hypothetical protein
VSLVTACQHVYAYSEDIPIVEEGIMKKMSTSELTARINRFMDSKKGKAINLADLSEGKTRRSYRRHVEVSGTPFIALAIK